MHSKIIEARKTLLRSAYHFIHHVGWSRYEWENDEEVIDYSKSHGLQDDLEHFSKLAFDGFGR